MKNEIKKSERLFYIQWRRLIIIANESKPIVLLSDIVYKIQCMQIYSPDGIYLLKPAFKCYFSFKIYYANLEWSYSKVMI